MGRRMKEEQEEKNGRGGTWRNMEEEEEESEGTWRNMREEKEKEKHRDKWRCRSARGGGGRAGERRTWMMRGRRQGGAGEWGRTEEEHLGGGT